MTDCPAYDCVVNTSACACNYASKTQCGTSPVDGCVCEQSVRISRTLFAFSSETSHAHCSSAMRMSWIRGKSCSLAYPFALRSQSRSLASSIASISRQKTLARPCTCASSSTHVRSVSTLVHISLRAYSLFFPACLTVSSAADTDLYVTNDYTNELNPKGGPYLLSESVPLLGFEPGSWYGYGGFPWFSFRSKGMHSLFFFSDILHTRTHTLFFSPPPVPPCPLLGTLPYKRSQVTAL